MLREVQGDVFFPEISEDEFRRTFYQKKDGKQPYTFAVYERFRSG